MAWERLRRPVLVEDSGLEWTVFRPSIIFGPGDGFVTLLAGVIRGNPAFIPVMGSGQPRFQPVSVRDVARVYGEALEKPETAGKAFEVGGPEVFTLNQLYRERLLQLEQYDAAGFYAYHLAEHHTPRVGVRGPRVLDNPMLS